MPTAFFERLAARARAIDSCIGVGLDPHPGDLSSDTYDCALAYCAQIVEATRDVALLYKPNAAFFERFGPAGAIALRTLIVEIIGDDGAPVLLDAKRGDIGSTALAYADAAFDAFGAHAVTVNPYLGEDGLRPFTDRAGRGAFVLCKTSNASAASLQDLVAPDGRPLYLHVADVAARSTEHDNVGLVVGATQPDALAAVRAAHPDLWLLAPGVGAQGGSLEAAVAAGLRDDGLGLVLPISRGIARADDQRAAAISLRDAARRARDARRTRRASAPAHAHAPLADALFDSGCVRFGRFTLKSGLESPIYIDLRRLVADPALMRQVARAYLAVMRGLAYDHVAALPYAALPIGTAIALEGGHSLVYPRREAKAYGTKAAVEGVYEPGERAIVVDDLATTGGTKIEAIDKLRDVGLDVQDVVVLVDRESGARETLEAAGFAMHHVFRFTDLLSRWRATDRIDASQHEEALAFVAASAP